MAQKDKVKELVGRGLGSYHAKSLQQIDRIERKNKEQNHKISMLTNELDNDYLTKTEEGSVISLDHSKEGMIYLDELQGNTLVNYCVDGAKELTLNGDIDVEGTNVTLTEGVDNGKVDVVCEGNTLVNLKYNKKSHCTIHCNNNTNNQFYKIEESSPIHCKGEIFETANSLGLSWYYYPMGNINTKLLKTNTTYTVILDNKYDSINAIFIQHGSATNTVLKSHTKVNKNIYVITTKDSFDNIVINDNDTILYGSLGRDYKGKVDFKIIAVLEGDWSNKEIPQSYFEGMKSVGECENNKFEILSRNDNLFVPTQHIPNGWSNGSMIVSSNYRTYWIECKPNTTYFIESDRSGNRFGVSCSDIIKFGGVAFSVTKGEIYGSSNDTDKVVSTIFTTDSTAKYLFVYTINNGVFPTPKIMISESSSEKTYIEPRLNKKEISLNEPLRGNDRLRDRVVKINGKFYIERNTIEYSSNELIDRLRFEGVHPNGRTARLGYDAFLTGNRRQFNICDKYKTKQVWDNDEEGIWADHNFKISLSVEKGNNADSLKEYLRNNPFKIVLEREKPVYEPLEVEPTLNTYTDITHISNNSTIPCNMKVTNSGYNAIIKPSTLYTVALDTNKSGTVGINLGGAKVTTTNNVATITTPATLTDDSLRLCGKGIKGSKVRLLEGDKTNWIPSFFEGMKSSFEDKVQSDGTFKMEILSNNKNLIKNGEKYKNWDGYTPYQKLENGFVLEYSVGRIAQNTVSLSNLKHGETYTFSCDVELLTPLKRTLQVYRFGNIKQDYGTHVNTSRKLVYTFKHDSSMPNIGVYLQGDEYTTAKANITNIQLEKNSTNTECVDRKYNKIQFSSIEPLRGVGDIKDKFVFKDGKLMIERNCGEVILNGNDIVGFSNYYRGQIRYPQDMKQLPNGSAFANNELFICDTLKVSQIPINQSSIEGYHNGKNTISGYKQGSFYFYIFGATTIELVKQWLLQNPTKITYQLAEPTYEEVPYELQKIILEGYENGTLFIDTNIPPTVTTTYAGETPIVKSVKLNKTEVSNNTTDINDNIVPYLMDMDYRVVCLQLEGGIENVSVARLFGGTFEMLQRDILSNRYSKEEYKYRLDAYLSANKITENEYEKLGDMLND